MPGVFYVSGQMVLSNLVQKVGVCRRYVAHIISCGFTVSGRCQDQPDCFTDAWKNAIKNCMNKSSWGWTLVCSQHVEDNWINENTVHFVGYYICISQCTVQKT